MGRLGKVALGAGLALGIAGGAFLYVRAGGQEGRRPERPPSDVLLTGVRTEELVWRVKAIGAVAAINSVTIATEIAGRLGVWSWGGVTLP